MMTSEGSARAVVTARLTKTKRRALMIFIVHWRRTERMHCARFYVMIFPLEVPVVLALDKLPTGFHGLPLAPSVELPVVMRMGIDDGVLSAPTGAAR